MVVEDQRSLAALAEHVIRSETGLDVVVARSKAEMLEALIAKGPFIAAVADLVLPDSLDGAHSRELVRQGVTTIVLTGRFDAEARKSFLNAGVADYVLKGNPNAYLEVALQLKRLVSNRTCSVLVVDDQRLRRELIGAVLERRCFQVRTASSVAEGLASLEANPCRVMLVDYVLPDGNGISLIEKVRRSHSKRDLAIIGISASDGSTLGVQFLKAGANDFLRVPFLEEELACRVEQNAELIETIHNFRDAALRDFLTGLHNRRYFYEAGNLLIENARRRNLSLSCAVFDIDHFKQINDTQGHDVGDMALRHVATILQKNLRGADLLARVGGEEFAALFINTDIEGATKAADKLRLAVKGNAFTKTESPLPITLSAGVASGGDNLEALLRRADEALYAAKAGGRDKVCVAPGAY